MCQSGSYTIPDAQAAVRPEDENITFLNIASFKELFLVSVVTMFNQAELR